MNENILLAGIVLLGVGVVFTILKTRSLAEQISEMRQEAEFRYVDLATDVQVNRSHIKVLTHESKNLTERVYDLHTSVADVLDNPDNYYLSGLKDISNAFFLTAKDTRTLITTGVIPAKKVKGVFVLTEDDYALATENLKQANAA